MEITVNQESFLVADACSLLQMMNTLFQKPTKGLAIAVNHEIVGATDWESYQLKAGDKVIIIKATQGG